MRIRISQLSILGLLVLATLIYAIVPSHAAPPVPGPSGYHVIKTVPVPGDTGWDYVYVDSAARRVYISHGAQTVVMDADTYAIVGTIPDTKGVHGIAIASDLGRGFTSNGGSNDVTIFDLKTFKVLGTAPTGEGPDAIIYDPASHRVFTMNGHGQSSTAIDGATGTVAGTIPLGGKPEFATADGAGHVYA